MQDLNDKVTGGTLTAAEWNEVPSEIQNVIEGLGITLSSGDLNQLGKAIAGYVGNGTFYTDSGAADAYVLSTIGSKQTPTAYTDGLEAEFIPANTNTGASTVNVAGLGVVDIAGTATAGTLTAGDHIRMRYNSGTGDFDIVNNTGTKADSQAVAKAWINFNGTGTIATRDSFNVAGIIDHGTGEYTVTIDVDFANANYTMVGMAGGGIANNLINISQNVGASAPAVGSARFSTTFADGSLQDAEFVGIAFFGDQ